MGKTSLAINLSVAMSRLGHRVALVDADFGLGNVDVMLGLDAGRARRPRPLGREIAARRADRRAVRPPRDARRIGRAAADGARRAKQRERLTAAIDEARRSFDFLVIDTAPGISDNVLDMLELADHVLLVTSLDPAALVDAYALAKVLWQAVAGAESACVVNDVRDGVEARLAFRQIDLRRGAFPRPAPALLRLRARRPARCARRCLIQRPIVDHLPQSPAGRCFRLLATRLATLSAGPGGVRLLGSPGRRRRHRSGAVPTPRPVIRHTGAAPCA